MSIRWALLLCGWEEKPAMWLAPDRPHFVYLRLACDPSANLSVTDQSWRRRPVEVSPTGHGVAERLSSARAVAARQAAPAAFRLDERKRAAGRAQVCAHPKRLHLLLRVKMFIVARIAVGGGEVFRRRLRSRRHLESCRRSRCRICTRRAGLSGTDLPRTGPRLLGLGVQVPFERLGHGIGQGQDLV